MRYAHFIFIFVLLSVICYGCSTPYGLLPTAKNLLKYDIALKPADIKAVNRGRALSIRECSACHRFYFPKEYSPEEWSKIIRKMGIRMSLDQKQIEGLNLYFQLASSAWRQAAR